MSMQRIFITNLQFFVNTVEAASMQNFSYIWLDYAFSYFFNHLGGDLEAFLILVVYAL